MGSRLNWESASRSERATRQGTEPFYRDLSPRDATSEIARVAFEDAAKRAAKNARKRRNTLTPAQARKELASKQKKREKRRESLLESYLSKFGEPSWIGTDELQKERAILRVDSILDEIGRGHVARSTLVLAHTAIVSYMDTLRDSNLYLQHCKMEGLIELSLSHLSIKNPEEAIDYVTKYVKRNQAKHLATLYGNINLSLKQYCAVTTIQKRIVTNQLVLRRVVAVTPSQRVLYYSKYCKAKSHYCPVKR